MRIPGKLQPTIYNGGHRGYTPSMNTFQALGSEEINKLWRRFMHTLDFRFPCTNLQLVRVALTF